MLSILFLAVDAVTRIILEFFGNYYEFVYAKSSYYMVLGYGLSVTGALLLPLIPSYVGHFAYAFPKELKLT